MELLTGELCRCAASILAINACVILSTKSFLLSRSLPEIVSSGFLFEDTVIFGIGDAIFGVDKDGLVGLLEGMLFAIGI